MKQEAYERTLRARAFDISRYLLPLATNTSLGEIVNARTLETQVAHLLSQPHKEVRDLGALLKKAALSPAYNANEESLRALVVEIRAVSPTLPSAPSRNCCGKCGWRPRWSSTPIRTPMRSRLAANSTRLPRSCCKVRRSKPHRWLIFWTADPLEIELAATLLYGQCHYSYRQIRRAVEAAGEARRREIIDLGLRHRGEHDELLRPFSAGQQFRFDILMDIGGFRDMHRHRRCVQIMQDFTTAHGYDTPPEVEAAGIRASMNPP